MDNKITKQRVSDHLEYDWYKYIIVVAAAIFLVVFAFNQINAEREVEKINIFFSCYEWKSNEFEQDVKTRMNEASYNKEEYGDNILSTVYLEFVSPTSNDYGSLVSTHGSISSDCVVFGKNYISGDGQNFENALAYLQFDDNVLRLCGLNNRDDIEFLRLNETGERVETGGKIYGVRIDNLKNIQSLATFYIPDTETATYDSEFFLFINKGSKNIGAYNKKADEKNNQTFFVLKTFFEIYG